MRIGRLSFGSPPAQHARDYADVLSKLPSAMNAGKRILRAAAPGGDPSKGAPELSGRQAEEAIGVYATLNVWITELVREAGHGAATPGGQMVLFEAQTVRDALGDALRRAVRRCA